MKNIDIHKLVRQHIPGMKPYSSARMEYEGKDGIFLDANENALGSVSGELHNRYPDPLQVQIKEKLAGLEKLHTDQIFLGNGSDECIDILIRAFCEPGNDSVLTCPPVFGMYEHSAHSQHIKVEEVLLIPETFQLNITGIKEVIQRTAKNLKIIFICSPNNPTGNLVRNEDIEDILNIFEGIVLVDEAYQDFSDNTSWINRLNDFKNLVVIKTFSKAWGMADARLGMLYADPEVIHYMNTIKLPYNVNQHTQELALEILGNLPKKQAFVKELNASRKYLEKELDKIPWVLKRFPTDANFILFKVPDADNLYKYLLENKLILRNRNKAPLCAGCLRVSVGTQEENDKFLEALRSYKS